MKTKTAIMIGAALGLIFPLVGMFAGLQVSAVLGTVLTFPLILLSMIIGVPLGDMGIVTFGIGVVFSIIAWALLVLGMSKLLMR